MQILKFPVKQRLLSRCEQDIIETHRRLRGMYPSSEELRMVRAILTDAVTEASLNGHAHLSFHAFRIDAERIPFALENELFANVELVVRHHGHIVKCEYATVCLDDIG